MEPDDSGGVPGGFGSMLLPGMTSIFPVTFPVSVRGPGDPAGAILHLFRLSILISVPGS
jgi:hypothetical protein